MNILPSKPDEIASLIKRAPYVECLAEGIDDKQEVKRRLNVSRATVDRAFVELEDAGISSSTGSDYRLTLYGEMLYQKYGNFVNDCIDVTEAKSLLRFLPPKPQIDENVFTSADLHHSKPPAPQEPLNQMETHVRKSDRMKGVFPIITQRTVYFLQEQVQSGLDCEFIFERNLLEHLSDVHPDLLNEFANTSKTEVRGATETLPFGLVITDETRVWVGIYDSNGGLKGAISNDKEAVIEWANNVFHQYRSHAKKYSYCTSKT